MLDASVTLATLVNPSVYGQNTTFSATVAAVSPATDTPTGSVAFYDNGTSLGSVVLDGNGYATIDISSLSVGNHAIEGDYAGDSNFGPASSSLTQTVSHGTTSTTVSLSPNPSLIGQDVTIGVTVVAESPAAGIPTGTVTFHDNGASLGTATLDTNGYASFDVTSLPVGTDAITATYAGDSNFNGSSGSADQTVTNTTTTITSDLNWTVYGQAMTFTATVAPVSPDTGTPSGTVTFTLAGQSQTVPLDSNGQATFSPGPVDIGTYAINATYSGDSDFFGSSDSVSQTVYPADTRTSLFSLPNPSIYGQAVTVTATVIALADRAGVPLGTLTFTFGSQTQTVALDDNGQAIFHPSVLLAVGTYTVTATYNGSGNLNTSSASTDLTVYPASTNVTGRLDVLDPATDQILPSNGTPINSYSRWAVSLEAQVSGTAVASYFWDVSQAPDVRNVSGDNSYNLQFTWASFDGTVNTDVISVTETGQDGTAVFATYVFDVTGKDNGGWRPAPPTSAATWPHVIAPDQLNGQATQAAGPYARVGLADGSVQTSHAMPSYNPNVAPFELLYNSAAADPQPVFLVRYQLVPNQDLPVAVTAQLTLTDQDGNTVYSGPAVSYDPTSLNPGDWMQMALQVNPAGLASGRYNWQVTVTAGADNPSYTGAFDFLAGSTGADNLTSAPFGPGWSPADLYRLLTVQGGVILQKPDGSSLWFAQNNDGSYATPASDFSTLSYNADSGLYTRTLKDGIQYQFNAAGQQVAIIDRNGYATTCAWNSANELTSITDMNGQVVTLTYNTGGYLVSAVDPADRSLTFGYNDSNQLTSLTDPDGTAWNYAYTAANQLTSVGDPTTFGYSEGMVSSISLPTGATQALTPAQAQGLSGAGQGSSGNPAPGLPLPGTGASFTTGNGSTSQVYLDGSGFGQTQQTRTPSGSTSLTDRDPNGLPWLASDGRGAPISSTFDCWGNTIGFT